jgi:hypothetical protein
MGWAWTHQHCAGAVEDAIDFCLETGARISFTLFKTLFNDSLLEETFAV